MPVYPLSWVAGMASTEEFHQLIQQIFLHYDFQQQVILYGSPVHCNTGVRVALMAKRTHSLNYYSVNLVTFTRECCCFDSYFIHDRRFAGILPGPYTRAATINR